MPGKYLYSFDSACMHRENICLRAAMLMCKDLLSSAFVAVQNWWFGPTCPSVVRFQHHSVWRQCGNWEDAAASRAFSIALARSELWAGIGSLGLLLRFCKVVDGVSCLHCLTLVQTQAVLAGYFRCLGFFLHFLWLWLELINQGTQVLIFVCCKWLNSLVKSMEYWLCMSKCHEFIEGLWRVWGKTLAEGRDPWCGELVVPGGRVLRPLHPIWAPSISASQLLEQQNMGSSWSVFLQSFSLAQLWKIFTFRN